MRYFEQYKVDGRPILLPDENIAISRTDLDSAESGRDESGIMLRTVVRHRVQTWEFSYSYLTAEEYRYLKDLFAGKTEFRFSYNDDGVTRLTTAYCSADSVTYRNARTGSYTGMKIKIVEC